MLGFFYVIFVIAAYADAMCFKRHIINLETEKGVNFCCPSSLFPFIYLYFRWTTEEVLSLR